MNVNKQEVWLCDYKAKFVALVCPLICVGHKGLCY